MPVRKIFFAFLALAAFSMRAWADTAALQNVHGDVAVLKHGGKDWIPGREAMTLDAGDRVKTGGNSSVEIQMDAGLVSLGEKTQFGLKKFETTEGQIKASLELTLGKLKAKVEKLREGSEFKVMTPTSVASVRGTVFDLWVFEYLEELFTRLDVTDGVVRLCGLNQAKCEDVGTGQHATSGKGDVTEPGEEAEGTIGDQYNSQEGLDQQNENAQKDIQDLFFPSGSQGGSRNPNQK